MSAHGMAKMIGTTTISTMAIPGPELEMAFSRP